MALPCALTLLPASLYASHPVDWPNFGVLTDWEAEVEGLGFRVQGLGV